MSHENITEDIIRYLECEPDRPHFAICLYGGWGTGKTYYCCNELASVLGSRLKVRLIRVSLFGVKDLPSLYQKLLGAMLGLSKESLPSTMGRVVVENAYLKGIKQLKRIGLTVSVPPETLLSLMFLNRTLIVLDDTERCQISDRELYGAINDMTENRQWYVLIVRNSPVNLTTKDGASDAEKAVLKQLHFIPDAEDLYDSLLLPYFEKEVPADFDFRRAVIDGLKEAGEINARSLLRVAPLIQKTMELHIFDNDSFAPSERASALTDLVRIACKVASGNTPKSDGDISEAQKALCMNRELERYQNLKVVLDPLEESTLADPKTMENCIRAYIDRYYPHSAADIQMKDLYERFKNWAVFEDEELIGIADQLRMFLDEPAFGPLWIYPAWEIVDRLIGLGFDDCVSQDAVVASLCAVIDHDPVLSSKFLLQREQYSLPIDDLNQPEVIHRLREYADNQVIKVGKRVFSNRTPVFQNRALDGALFVHEITELMEAGINPAEVIDPDTIVDCFWAGDASSQMALHELFGARLAQYSHVFNRSQDTTVKWLNKIESCFEARASLSKMGGVRANWICGDLRRLAKEISSGVSVIE